MVSMAVLISSKDGLRAQPADKPKSPRRAEAKRAVEKLPAAVRARLQLRAPRKDKLVYGLEQDFVELLKTAENPQALLKAERLLETTNNNSRWTNYMAATRLLREHREKAAIPLLLRYIVLHTEPRSSLGSVSEYAKTISVVSGHRLEDPYESGPKLGERMRAKVEQIVAKWWSKQKHKLQTKVGKLSTDQLRVIVDLLLKEIRKNGRFSGSGGAIDTAYGAYHRVFYGVMSESSSDRFTLRVVHPDMVALALQSSGYNVFVKNVKAKKRYRIPYEAILILRELIKNGQRDAVAKIAGDKRQNSTVRLVCILSLYRAGGEFRTDDLLEILKQEKQMEHRLVLLCALQFGGKKSVPVLLSAMDDPNIEIATAAACAMRSARSPEALRKLEKLIRKSPSNHPVLLLSALAEYKNGACRAILAALLRESLKGGPGTIDLSRVLSAFEDACEHRWLKAGRTDAQRRKAAHTALAWYREDAEEAELKHRALTALLGSAKTQWETAVAIEQLRHKEYKRLLALQGDLIVTPEQTQAAYQRLVAVRAEVKAARTARDQAQVALEALKSRLK